MPTPEEKKQKACERSRQWYYDNLERAKKSRRQYHKKNCKKIIERSRLWAEEHPEKVKENQRRYSEKHIGEIRERGRQWYIEHPDKVKERSKQWQKENPEKKRAYNRRWIKRNPEKKRANGKRWAKANKKRKYETDRLWREANSEKVKKARIVAEHKRRAKIKGNGGYFTVGEWELLKKQYNNTCPMCGKEEPEIKLTVDHIIPISKGGSSWIENIQPLCQSCNSRKSTKIIAYNNNGQVVVGSPG